MLTAIANEFLDSERHLREAVQAVGAAAVGARLRRHREAMQLSIRRLAELALVSKSSIVAVEQGKSSRPATIAKLCSAMNLHVERIVGEAPTDQSALSPFHLHTDDRWFVLDDLTGRELDAPTAQSIQTQDNLMVMLRNVPPDAKFIAGTVTVAKPTERRQHPGQEIAFVLEGEVEISVGQEVKTLSKGESAFIPAETPHHYAPAHGAPQPATLFLVRVH
ncbi:MAG: cupin domain-containing protein [Armatimonadetes bacterium]|nr:cupin domain-containing protein [Armatimonadota bacterium]